MLVSELQIRTCNLQVLTDIHCITDTDHLITLTSNEDYQFQLQNSEHMLMHYVYMPLCCIFWYTK